jgi:hypothetical protein
MENNIPPAESRARARNKPVAPGDPDGPCPSNLSRVRKRKSLGTALLLIYWQNRRLGATAK